MTRIIIGEDCGNSPKNIFVQELTIAFAKGDLKFLLKNMSDDIRWNRVGDQVIEGRDHFAEVLEDRKKKPVAELSIHHIATHGKAGAVDGILKFKNGKTCAFCDVYAFGNSKGTSVAEIISYVIEIE